MKKKYSTANDDEKKEVITKLSLCKFSVKLFEIAVVLSSGITITISSNDRDDIRKYVARNYNGEPVVKTLNEFWSDNEKLKIREVLKKYKREKPIRVDKPQIVCKLYHEKSPAVVERQESGRCWIDYNKQTINGVVHDIRNGSGIWTVPIEYFYLFITDTCFERYGDSVMILETISGEKYITNSKHELICDKYKHIYAGPLADIKTWELLKRLLGNDYLKTQVSEKMNLIEDEKNNDIVSVFNDFINTL